MNEIAIEPLCIYGVKVRAFTLVEVLVVIGIIAVIAAILVPVLASAKRAAAATACMSNVRQIGMSSIQYAGDNDEGYPFDGADNNRWLQRIHLAYAVGPSGIKSNLECPTFEVPTDYSLFPSGYAFNGCTPLKAPPIPTKTVLIGEVAMYHLINRPDIPIFSDFLDMPDSFLADRSRWIHDEFGSKYAPSGEWGALRHQGRGNYMFFDGSAKKLPPDAFRLPSAGFACVKDVPGWIGPAHGPVFNPLGAN